MAAPLSERELLVALEKLKGKKLDLCFDPDWPDSRPCPTQLDIFKYKGEPHEVKKIIVRAPNRVGKSTSGARIISWWFQNKHPYMERPASWGDGPLTLMVVGENLSNIETELWGKKISRYLPKKCYHIVRSGGTIQRVENTENGNTILFRSHHGNENVREKLQGITAHVVWLDEMPATASIITELLLRLLSTKGFFYATFTPLVKNDDIRKMCDQTSNGWVTFIPMADTNPIYKDNMEAYEAEIRSMSSSEEEYRSRRYGEWWYGSGRVVKAYHPKLHRQTLPSDYSSMWRHVVIVDPAASGTAGVCLVGEDPKTNRWWVVRAFYLDGDAPSSLVRSVETAILGYNIIERRCDCNPASFYMEALKQGITYMPHRDKNNRKHETIDRLNEKFQHNMVFLSDSSATDSLHEELMSCSWSEHNSERIVNESSYHTLDTLRYFADNIPAPLEKPMVFENWTQEIKHQHEKRRDVAMNRFEQKKKARSKFIVKSRSFF